LANPEKLIAWIPASENQAIEDLFSLLEICREKEAESKEKTNHLTTKIEILGQAKLLKPTLLFSIVIPSFSNLLEIYV